MAAEGRAVEDIPDEDRKQDHQHRAIGKRGMDRRRHVYADRPQNRRHTLHEIDTGAEPLQEGGGGLDVLLADGFAARIVNVERAEDAPGTERHDEGRQLEERDQHAVDRSTSRADGKTQGKSDPQRHAVDHRGPAHHHRAENHDDTDREIDAGGENYKRLGDAEDRNDGDLLEHQRQVEWSEELGADNGAEDEKPEDENDEGNRGREGVEEMLDAAERALLLFLENHGRRINRRQGFLEIRRTVNAARFGHGIGNPTR